jgi:RNA polymerase-binding transcription factor DksA
MATKKTQGARTSHPRSAAASRPGPGAGKRITARDLKSFRRRLEDELTVLTGRHAGLEAASATSPDVGGAGGYGEEASDAGSFTSERERDLSLAGNLRDLIEKIQGALERIDEGSYGRCEVCGQPIEAERLDALPYTTLCLADARRRARAR